MVCAVLFYEEDNRKVYKEKKKKGYFLLSRGEIIQL